MPLYGKTFFIVIILLLLSTNSAFHIFNLPIEGGKHGFHVYFCLLCNNLLLSDALIKFWSMVIEKKI